MSDVKKTGRTIELVEYSDGKWVATDSKLRGRETDYAMMSYPMSPDKTVEYVKDAMEWRKIE